MVKKEHRQQFDKGILELTAKLQAEGVSEEAMQAAIHTYQEECRAKG